MEMLKDMKALRGRQAGLEGDSDADGASERRTSDARRKLQDVDSSSNDASELEEEHGSDSHDEAQSLVSDEEAEGGDEAPLEDIMAMQVRWELSISDWGNLAGCCMSSSFPEAFELFVET
jgi:hypothetical protein